MAFIPRRHLAALAFPLAIAVVVTLLTVNELAYHRSLRALDATTESFDLRVQVDRLLRLMVDAETGQRGYLLTGRGEYLKPYADSTQAIGELIKNLTQRYTQPDRAAQLTEIGTLAGVVEKKISELDLTVQLKRDGRDDAWRAITDSDIGREAQDSIRQIAGRLADIEVMRMAAHREQVDRTLLAGRIGVAALALLSLLGFRSYLRRTRQLAIERERQRDALQAERDSLEGQVVQRTQRLVQLARHLQNTQESERSRLARELHDELGALLTSAKLDVARLQSRLPESNTEARERMHHLTELLNSGIALKRRIIENLRPSSLDNLGLAASLDILTREFAERAGLVVDAQLDPPALSPSAQLTVYRFVQEGLTNIAKYAQARRVEVHLSTLDDGSAEVMVADDGLGFDPEAMQAGQHGLVGMRYRVEAERGRMHIESKPGCGTRLVAWLPVATT